MHAEARPNIRQRIVRTIKLMVEEMDVRLL